MAGYGEGPNGSTTRIWEGFPQLLTIRLQETQGFSDLMEWVSPAREDSAHLAHRTLGNGSFSGRLWVN